MKKMIKVKINEYHWDDVTRNIYIYDDNELCFSLEQTKEVNLLQILREILDDETMIELSKAIHYSDPDRKDKYFCEFFVFSKGELKRLEPDKNIKINTPLQVPEEIELSVWVKDYTDWGGKCQTEAHLRKELKEILGIKEISFYKRAGEGYEYWTSPAEGVGLGKLYTTEVLQDILKALGVKKIRVKEHRGKFYHPASSRLFGLSDYWRDSSYEINLENQGIKNKYIVIQDENKLEIYVELLN